MRPRHKAAENGDVERPDPLPYHASMRPRHKAAENDECYLATVLKVTPLQ